MILCLFLGPVYDHYYFFPLWINIYLGIVSIFAVHVAYLYHHTFHTTYQHFRYMIVIYGQFSFNQASNIRILQNLQPLISIQRQSQHHIRQIIYLDRRTHAKDHTPNRHLLRKHHPRSQDISLKALSVLLSERDEFILDLALYLSSMFSLEISNHLERKRMGTRIRL